MRTHGCTTGYPPQSSTPATGAALATVAAEVSEPHHCGAGSGVVVVLRQALSHAAPKEICDQLRNTHKRSATGGGTAAADASGLDELTSLDRDIAAKALLRQQFQELLELGSASSVAEMLALLQDCPALAAEPLGASHPGEQAETFGGARLFHSEDGIPVLPLAVALLRGAADEVVEAVLLAYPEAAARGIPWALVPRPPHSARLQLPSSSGPRVQGIRVDFARLRGTPEERGSELSCREELRARCGVVPPHLAACRRRQQSRWHRTAKGVSPSGLAPLHYALLVGRKGRLIGLLLKASETYSASLVPLPQPYDHENLSTGVKEHASVLEILLWSRQVYPETALLHDALSHMALGGSPSSASGTGDSSVASAAAQRDHDFSIQGLALTTCAVDDAEAVAAVARLGDAEARLCLRRLGMPSGDGPDLFEPIRTALRTVAVGRRILTDVKAGTWDRRELLEFLRESPSVTSLLLDGRPLLWWMLMFKIDSDVVLRFLEYTPLAVEGTPLIDSDLLLLALFRGCSKAVFRALAVVQPEAWPKKADVGESLADFEVAVLGLHPGRSSGGPRPSPGEFKNLGPTLWHAALAVGCCGETLALALDVYPDLARQSHTSGVVPLLLALQHPGDDGRLWRRICEIHPEGVPVVFDRVTSLLEGASAWGRDSLHRSVPTPPPIVPDRDLLSKIPAATLQAFFKFVQRHTAAAPGSRHLASELDRRGQCSAMLVADLLRVHGVGLARVALTCKTGTADLRCNVVRPGVDEYGDAVSVGALLPLHYALVKQAPLPVILELYRAFPQAVCEEVALGRPPPFPWRGPAHTCFAFDFLLRRIIENKTPGRYWDPSPTHGPRGSQSTEELESLRQMVSLAVDVLSLHPAVLVENTPLGTPSPRPEDGSHATSSASPWVEIDTWAQPWAPASRDTNPSCTDSALRRMLAVTGSSLATCLPLVTAMVEHISSQMSQGRQIGKDELVLALDSKVSEVINALVVACPSSVAAVDQSDEGRTADRPAVVRLLDGIRNSGRSDARVDDGLLSPVRDWPRERLVWIGHSKEAEGVLSSLPSHAVRLICKGLGRPSSLRLLLEVRPECLTAERPAENGEKLAQRCVRQLLEYTDSPFDPVCVRRILQIVPSAARTPFTLRRRPLGDSAEYQGESSFVLPLQAIAMNRKVFAPKLAAWTCNLFPQALCAVDSKGVSPLTALLSRTHVGGGAEAAPAAMLREWVDLTARHCCDSTVTDAGRTFGYGSLVKVDGEDEPGTIMSLSMFRQQANASSQGTGQPCYLVSFPRSGSERRVSRPQSHEAVVVEATRIASSLSRRVPPTSWLTPLTALLLDTSPRLDLISRVLDRSPALALVAERTGAPRPLELALRLGGEVASEVIPRLLQHCPKAAGAPLSVRSSVELGLGAEATAVPVLLALELRSPTDVTMALLRANPDCSLCADIQAQSHAHDGEFGMPASAGPAAMVTLEHVHFHGFDLEEEHDDDSDDTDDEYRGYYDDEVEYWA